MAKPHKAIHNLGKFAHPAKTNVNVAAPGKAQTHAETPKLIGKPGDKGKHSTAPGFTKGGKKTGR